MSANRGKKNLLERIDDISLNMIHSDSEAARAFLIEEGFDVDEEAKYAEQQIKKLHFLTKAVANRDKDERLLEHVLARLKQSMVENAQKTTNLLKTILQSKTPAVQYRKLEKWSDEEIIAVLHDVDLVKLLEELDNNPAENV